jgi:repressor LexA
MVVELSPRQKRILDFITEHVRQHGYPPSVREIGAAVHLRSSSTVHGHLNRLEAKGYLRRDPSKPRAMEVLRSPSGRAAGGRAAPVATQARRVPILGRVAAGQPLLAVEEATDTFPLPVNWIHDDEVFMLTVEGESMVDAGILPGDLLVVRRQPNAFNGDIVVALIGEEVTVKRFFREGGRVRLQPENASMQPIFVDTVSILGKVVGLVRRM